MPNIAKFQYVIAENNISVGGDISVAGAVCAACLYGDGSNLSGIVGGADTQIQYNNAGSLAGDAGLVYNCGTNKLTVGGDIAATAFCGLHWGSVKEATSVCSPAATPMLIFADGGAAQVLVNATDLKSCGLLCAGGDLNVAGDINLAGGDMCVPVNTDMCLYITTAGCHLYVSGGDLRMGANNICATAFYGSGANLTALDPANIVQDGATDAQVMTWCNACGCWTPMDVSVTPGGADTQVQFNDGGSFDGDPGLTWNKTLNSLRVFGDVKTCTVWGTGNLHLGACSGYVNVFCNFCASCGVRTSLVRDTNSDLVLDSACGVICAAAPLCANCIDSCEIFGGVSGLYLTGDTCIAAGDLDVGGCVITEKIVGDNDLMLCLTAGYLCVAGCDLRAGANNICATAFYGSGANLTALDPANIAQDGASPGEVLMWCSGCWQPQAAGGGTPAGANTQVQFNNSGSFGASAGMTWNGSYLTARNLGATCNVTAPDGYLGCLHVSGGSIEYVGCGGQISLDTNAAGSWVCAIAGKGFKGACVEATIVKGSTCVASDKVKTDCLIGCSPINVYADMCSCGTICATDICACSVSAPNDLVLSGGNVCIDPGLGDAYVSAGDLILAGNLIANGGSVCAPDALTLTAGGSSVCVGNVDLRGPSVKACFECFFAGQSICACGNIEAVFDIMAYGAVCADGYYTAGNIQGATGARCGICFCNGIAIIIP